MIPATLSFLLWLLDLLTLGLLLAVPVGLWRAVRSELRLARRLEASPPPELHLYDCPHLPRRELAALRREIAAHEGTIAQSQPLRPARRRVAQSRV